MRYLDLPHNLSAQFEEAALTYAAFCAAEAERTAYAGSLYWGRQSGVEYLLRSDTRRKVKRLGVRNAATEAIYAAFIAARQHAREQYQLLSGAMKRQQKLNRVLRVGHVPAPWICILSGIRSAGMTDQVIVTGTAATYAYECAGSVRIDNARGSVASAAVLAERCSRLQLTVPSPAAALQLLDVIQQAAPAFQIHRGQQRHLAIDPQGLEVSVLLDGDTERAPAFLHSVAGVNGEMATMRAMAPRAFVLHRLHLANQPGRDPLERRRDASLAQLVMAIILERLAIENERTTMVSKLDDYFSLDKAALNLRAQRQQLLASNIANADTPNYKARDIDFNSALQAALQTATAAPALASTNARHQQPSALEQILSAPVQYRGVVQGSVDGNTVDMDTERNQFADNALRYEAMLTMTASDAKTMLSAIQGGN